MDLESLKNPNYHMVLFTGGLDSTYRICQLAIDKDAIIQPVYILFPNILIRIQIISLNLGIFIII